MPIYKFFSFITLSFLYRPLVYNFLDNKFGRRILLALVPLYCFVFYLSTLNNVRSNYLSKSTNSSVNYSSNNNYFSLLEKNEYVKNAAIQSKTIKDPFVKIFIPFKEKTEDLLLAQNKQLKPREDNRGLKSNLFLGNNPKDKKKIRKKKDSTNVLYLNAFNNMYSVKIDTISFDSNFIITETNKQLGFETTLPLKNISEGKHALKITRQIIVKKIKKEEIDKVAEIPFWYYKD